MGSEDVGLSENFLATAGNYEAREDKEELICDQRARLNHLDEESEGDIKGPLRDTETILLTVDELLPASVLIKHSFELKDPTPIRNRQSGVPSSQPDGSPRDQQHVRSWYYHT